VSTDNISIQLEDLYHGKGPPTECSGCRQAEEAVVVRDYFGIGD